MSVPAIKMGPMRVFAATAGLDPRDGGFNFAFAGELVYIGVMCDDDALLPDPSTGECGCGRAFSGVTSCKATTLAVVKEMDITRRQYIEVLSSAVAVQWPGYDGFMELAEWMADVAQTYEDGTVLTRAGDEIRPLAAL